MVTPPCTGPGWSTVLRGALRNPKRWPIGCAGRRSPALVAGADPSTNVQRLADLVDVDLRVEGA